MRPRGKGTGHGARMISEQTLCLTFLSCEWGKPCLPLGTIGDIRGVPACESIYLEGAWHTLSMQEMLTIYGTLSPCFLAVWCPDFVAEGTSFLVEKTGFHRHCQLWMKETLYFLQHGGIFIVFVLISKAICCKTADSVKVHRKLKSPLNPVHTHTHTHFHKKV